MDISQLTAKERKAARKDLLKMIDSYNKQQRKTRRPSFPLSPPSKVRMAAAPVHPHMEDVDIDGRGFAHRREMPSNHPSINAIMFRL